MSHIAHLAPAVLPACAKYPDQAAPLVQAYTDLSLAQSWKDLEVIDLDECLCAVVRGKPKRKSRTSYVLPLALTTPTSLAHFTSIFTALAARFPTPLAVSPATLYLAIVEKDSSLVYYVVRNGIVSPKEVPE